MLFFEPYPIICATFVSFIVSILWHSKFLFGRAWMIAEGVEGKHIRSHAKLYRFAQSMYTFLGHGVMIAVLALLLDLLQTGSLKVMLALALLMVFGFTVSFRFLDMIQSLRGVYYGKEEQVRFLIGSLYALVTVTLGTITLYFTA